MNIEVVVLFRLDFGDIMEMNIELEKSYYVYSSTLYLCLCMDPG